MTKKILAILMVLALVFAFAACGKEAQEETTTETTTEATTETATEAESKEDASEAVTDESGEAASEEETEETKEAGKAPETTEEIVTYFNEVINNAKSNSKSITLNYSKISLNGSCTLPSSLNTIMKLLGGADSFIGDQLAKNSKGTQVISKSAFPVENESYASKLTAADVSSATCTEADGKYTITITTLPDGKSANVVHGTGHAPKAFNVILPGVVNDNIPSVATGIAGTATMNYPASTVKVVVDVETGHVLTADYTLKWTINFDKLGAILPFVNNDSYTFAW